MIARTAASRARKCVVGVDHEKFGRQAPIATVALEDVDVMVTDRPPPEAIARAMALAEVVTLVARKKD